MSLFNSGRPSSEKKHSNRILASLTISGPISGLSGRIQHCIRSHMSMVTLKTQILYETICHNWTILSLFEKLDHYDHEDITGKPKPQQATLRQLTTFVTQVVCTITGTDPSTQLHSNSTCNQAECITFNRSQTGHKFHYQCNLSLRAMCQVMGIITGDDRIQRVSLIIFQRKHR